MRTGTAKVTAIAIDVVVVVIPIGAAATPNAAIRTRHHLRHVWAPIGGVVIDNNAVMADAPATPPLPPSGATKTRNGTTLAAATMTATATEEEEYN